MFGRFERNTCFFGGFSGSEVYFLCFKNVPSIFYVLLCFSRTHRSGVHLSCMSPSESEEKSNTFSPRHASCQLNTLLFTTTVDCYCKYRRVLDPGDGSTQTDIRRETDGTQQEHWQCLLLAFFFFLYVGMDTIQNAKPVMHATGGKRLYQWMGHAFVCLLGSLTITQQLK